MRRWIVTLLPRERMDWYADWNSATRIHASNVSVGTRTSAPALASPTALNDVANAPADASTVTTSLTPSNIPMEFSLWRHVAPPALSVGRKLRLKIHVSDSTFWFIVDSPCTPPLRMIQGYMCASLCDDICTDAQIEGKSRGESIQPPAHTNQTHPPTHTKPARRHTG